MVNGVKGIIKMKGVNRLNGAKGSERDIKVDNRDIKKQKQQDR